MNDLTNQLDERFSDPGSTATPWADTRQVLESAELFWISTVRADGRPHVTPLVAVWHDEALHFSMGPGEQKAINLATSPHVVLTTGCNGWEDGLDVMVEGEARPVTDRIALERLAGEWARKGTSATPATYPLIDDQPAARASPTVARARRGTPVLAASPASARPLATPMPGANPARNSAADS